MEKNIIRRLLVALFFLFLECMTSYSHGNIKNICTKNQFNTCYNNINNNNLGKLFCNSPINSCLSLLNCDYSLTHYYDNIASMKADINLEEGMFASTFGYFTINDGGNAKYYIRSKKHIDNDDGGNIIFLKNGNVAELLANDTVNIKQFGAVGDGITDDTFAIRNALKNEHVILNSGETYLCSEQINIQNKLSIQGNNASIYLNGDVQYLFSSEAPLLEVKDLHFVKIDSSFSNLNRAIFGNRIDKFIVENLTFNNFGTGIHNKLGKEFMCSNIIIKNIYSIQDHYGYGINTSAVYNEIYNILGRNEDDSNGRHLIYLNGPIMEYSKLKNIKCLSWNLNPINIRAFNSNKLVNVFIENCSFDNTNIVPTNHGDNGNINLGLDSKVKCFIKNIIATRQRGTVVSSFSADNTVTVEDVRAEYVEDTSGNIVNTQVIYLRNGKGHIIKGINVVNEVSQFDSIVRIRDSADSVVDKIYNTFVKSNKHVIRAWDATVYLGKYYANTLEPFVITGTGLILVDK